MAKKKKDAQQETPAEETAAAPEETVETEATQETPETQSAAQPREPEVDWKKKYEEAHDAHLRVAAEFDNFRKRTIKEKEASYGNGKADAVAKILPIYDNLERALNQETTDAAYKKGVEMTMTELLKILSGLGVEVFGNVGDAFDPNIHNAVMHTENPDLGENTIAMVFQKGFKMGDKIVRFAMVQVAN